MNIKGIAINNFIMLYGQTGSLQRNHWEIHHISLFMGNNQFYVPIFFSPLSNYLNLSKMNLVQGCK